MSEAEYTLPTDVLREDYTWYGRDSRERDARRAAFDRWLAAHDAEVAARALREAADCARGSDMSPFWLHNRAERIERQETPR